MKNDNKYSVLMSLYNKETPEYLEVALKSILEQSIAPDEIIIVEDGPLTDELYSVVNKYKKEYPDVINIIVNEKNMGLGISLERGLEACHNELVARMDTDDIAVYDRCEKQLLYLGDNPNCVIVGGQIDEFIGTPENIVGRRVVPENDIDLKEYIKKRCPFNHMTVMFRKSPIIAAGSYQNWFWNEDYYLWIRLALKNYVFANLSDTLVFVRVGTDMYKRRGGRKYFASEKGIQAYMYNNHMISINRYVINILERFIVQILMPNWLRGFVFQKIARTKP